MKLAMLAAALVMLPILASAQPSGQKTPAAIDPSLTAAPSTLSAQTVQGMQKRLRDWAELGRYRADNAQLPAPDTQRVVFYGDSITDAWGRDGGTTFFPGKPYVNRGISGQTTAQMLLRFRQDVIDLKPGAVVILAGTNDIAGNTGLASPRMIQDNLRSMAELAKANGIAVILASILPVSDYPWRPGLQPADKVRRLNAWIRDYARAHGITYLDYYTALANADGGMDRELAADGVHPTSAGYAKMAPLAQQAIDATLKTTAR